MIITGNKEYYKSYRYVPYREIGGKDTYKVKVRRTHN